MAQHGVKLQPPRPEQSEARAHLRLGCAKSVRSLRDKAKSRARAKAKTERDAIAIYHATTKPLSRSAGCSSVAAAAYRAGVALVDARTGMTHDFTRRSGVAASFIMAPGNAGEFASDRESLWNAAEAAEQRKDARTAREWILALPSELAAEQRADLARDFARELVERYGVAVDVAIHAPREMATSATIMRISSAPRAWLKAIRSGKNRCWSFPTPSEKRLALGRPPMKFRCSANTGPNWPMPRWKRRANRPASTIAA